QAISEGCHVRQSCVWGQTRRDLVDHGAEGPYVHLSSVRLRLVKELRRHPVRCADKRRPLVEFCLYYASDAKVAQLNSPSFVDENVGTLDVAMYDALLVYPEDGLGNFP